MTFRADAYRIYSRWFRNTDRGHRSVYQAVNEAYEAGRGECQGADFSKVAAVLAAGVEEHIRRDGLSSLKAALFRSRGGHAPGEVCPSDPNPEPIHDQSCGLLYDGDECTCGAWRRQAPRANGSNPSGGELP